MLTDEKLCDEDRLILSRLSDRCLDISKARVLALEFQRLMFEKDVQALSAWFTTIKSSGLPDLVSFATYLDRERKPLEAAILEVWSKREQPARCCLVSKNGRTEGHVNRLKLIKRQRFGQAGFELLRKRVLLA